MMATSRLDEFSKVLAAQSSRRGLLRAFGALVTGGAFTRTTTPAVFAGSPSGCPEGMRRCRGLCVHVDSDPNNCGGCGNVCTAPSDGAAPVCCNGTCGRVDVCSSGTGCNANSDCRTNLCFQGQCQCIENNAASLACTSDVQCCHGACLGGVCVCQPLGPVSADVAPCCGTAILVSGVCCLSSGSAGCSMDSDCCSGSCAAGGVCR